MSQEQKTRQSGTSAKGMKSNDPSERAVNNEQQLADIFKLTIDCFEEIFDFLSLNDLTAIGRTCKRMYRIARHCFQLNYGGEKARFESDLFYLEEGKVDCFRNVLQNVSYNSKNYQERNCFGRRNTARDKKDSFDHLMEFLFKLERSTSIRGIEISFSPLTMDWIYAMEEVLSRIGRVALKRCTFDKNVLDKFLAACSNVKYLSLAVQNMEHPWMHRVYPTLEHIELGWGFFRETPELKTFFELNTTIKQFSVNTELLWSNRELFKNLNIKLDILAIDHNNHKVELDSFCHLLNEFHASGFYKKLHFYEGYRSLQEIIDQLASAKGLVKFRAGSNDDCINDGALRNLEELRVDISCSVTDLKSLPHILSKLKRISFTWASSDDILLFICRAEKLNKIKVKNFHNGPHYDENDKILDLLALSEEREKLFGACKITIYVTEEVYLATKWAMKQTEFSMIEMKRITSYEW